MTDSAQLANDHLSLLYRLSQTFTASLDLDTVLNRVMDEVIAATNAERGFVMLTQAGQPLVFRVARGMDHTTIDDPEFHISRNIVEEVVQQGSPLLTNDAQTDNRLQARPSVKQLMLRSILCVPLTLKNHVLGVIYVDNRFHVGVFSQADLDLLRAIASSAAIAVENARLYAERTQELSAALTQVEALAATEERNRLARELHDSVTQTIFGMTLTADTARILLERDPSKVPAQLARLQSLSKEALAEMRTLISELRPQAVSKAGLTAALEKHFATLQSQHNLQVSLTVEGDEALLSPQQKHRLFRIVQEALNNVVKHAQTDQATVYLGLNHDHIQLRIADEGQGFDLAQAADSLTSGQHIGLVSMRERVEQMGGRFQIDSQPSSGTRITVEIPGIFKTALEKRRG